MSAFIVTNRTITAIADGLHRYNISIENPDGSVRPEDYDTQLRYVNAYGAERINPRTGYSKAAQALLDMNYRSVNARYREDDAPRAFKAEKYTRESEGGLAFPREYTLAEVFGAVQCYEYQACECREYAASGIPSALQRLKDSIAAEVLAERFGELGGDLR